jgi:hypothetical protein
LLYRIDLPNDTLSQQILKAALAALGNRVGVERDAMRPERVVDEDARPLLFEGCDSARLRRRRRPSPSSRLLTP